MRQVKLTKLLAVCGTGVILSAAGMTIRPAATNEALVNPGMGWVYYHYDDSNWCYGAVTEPGDTLDWFPGASVIYFRIPWCDIEPEEGVFRWDVIDTYAQPWLAAGKQLAFRLTCEESGYVFATPEWVKAAGAKGSFFGLGKSERQVWEPDWLDPVFLEKLGQLLAAAAARWDRETTAFVDVGSFGMWGEGHTCFTSKLSAERQAEIARVHARLHKRHFRVAPVVISDDVAAAGYGLVSDDHPLMAEMRKMGVGFRDDSIMVGQKPCHWFHQKWARHFADAGLPVVVETQHFWNSEESRKRWLPNGLLDSTVEYRAHYQGIHWWPRDFLENNREEIAKTNRRLGYRFELREASWPDRVGNGKAVTVSTQWANVGVTTPQEPVFVCWTLLDDKGVVRWTSVDESVDFRSLPPSLEAGECPRTIASCVRFGWNQRSSRGKGKSPFVSLHSGGEVACGFHVPTVAPGAYTLAVSLGRRDGTPRVALPHSGQVGKTRRYALGRITVLPHEEGVRNDNSQT